jgi:hypothetical protein
MSQNQLARRGSVDPAYVNRLERDTEGTGSLPSRRVVFGLWAALEEESLGRVGTQDRERLLVAAGLVPETILQAGGWDAYLTRVRKTFSDVYFDLNEALTGVDDGPDAVQADRDLPDV